MRPIMLVVAACSLPVVCFGGAVDEGVAHDREVIGCSRAKSGLSEAAFEKRSDRVGRGILIDATGDTDLLHNDLELEVNFSNGQLSGSNTMTVRSLVDGLDSFTIRLNDAFTVDSALLNGVTPVNANPNSSNTAVVALGQVFDTGEEFTLTVVYHGVPQQSGFGSINIDTFSRIAFSLSEPWGAADWFPCKDSPNGSWGDNSDKSTADISVITPGDRSAVANGTKLGVDNLSGGRLRHRFSTGYPTTTYLFAFAIDNFQPWERSFTYDVDGSPVTMPVIFNIESDSWRGDQMVDMLTTFSDLYGVYPFINELYGVYQFGFGGGMEHQTNSGQSTLNATFLNAHELGHQWWGDMVTCDSWHDLWLNEGFATYSEVLWKEFEGGSSNKQALHSRMLNDPNNWTSYSCDAVEPSHRNDFDGFFGERDYDKGAWMLHMLRWVIGDDAFFDMLTIYRNNHEYATAEADDLKVAAETASGIDLDWYFDQWVYEPALPTYRTRDAVVTIAGQNYAAVYIDQQPASGTNAVQMPMALLTHDGGSVERELKSWVRNGEPHTMFVPLEAGEDDAELSYRWILMYRQISGPSYPFGAPKVLRGEPGVGATMTDIDHLEVVFSQDVTPPADRFTLIGPGGTVPLTASYPEPYVVHLTPASVLAAGGYTLTVTEDVGGSDLLDGEVGGGQLVGFDLPSGDGLAGGEATWAFTAESSCPWDLTGDGVIDSGDLGEFITLFLAGDLAVDFTGDGVVDSGDLSAFIVGFLAGC